MSKPVRSSYFNSIKVQLKLFNVVFAFISFVFQFHKGTIKTACGCSGWSWLLDFNSIKVQLKHYSGEVMRNFFAFQFHKGTIKTRVSLLPLLAYYNFNSIKVQLKPG